MVKFFLLALTFLLINATPFLFSISEEVESSLVALNQEYIASNSSNPTLSDSYLEGYIQANIDEQFQGVKVKVIVRNRLAYLYRMPKNEETSNQIYEMVSKTPGIKGVRVEDRGAPTPKVEDKYQPPKPQIKGIWFPQNTVLYPPHVADPRAVLNSISYRWQWRQASQYEGKNGVAISFGDIFPIYRWIDLGSAHAKLQINIEAGAWPIFRLDHEEKDDWSEFVNVDFFLGIPVTMAFENWSFRWRIYHVSTHLGDEFIENNPGFVRLNPSYEAVDLYTQWQMNDYITPYAGMGVIFRSDKSFFFWPLYVEFGWELRLLRRVVHYNRLYGQLFFGGHYNINQTRHWALDQTYVGGYEWSKLRGAGRKFRVFAEYHNGFSPDGQFYRMRFSWFGFRISFGF